MSTFQNVHQFLHHICQLTPSFPQYRLSSSHSAAVGKPEADIICKKSLLRTVKGCKHFGNLRLLADDSVSHQLQHRILKSNYHSTLLQSIDFKRNIGALVRELQNLLCSDLTSGKDYYQPEGTKLLTRESCSQSFWQLKYLSGNTFEDNKREYIENCNKKTGHCCILNKKNPYLTNSIFTARNPFVPFYSQTLIKCVQAHGFKTERKLQHQPHSDGGFSAFLRRIFGFGPPPQQLSSMKKPNLPKDEAVIKYLSDEMLSNDEKQRIKLAFAEGFLAGTQNINPNKPVRWVKLLQQILTIALVLGVFVTLIASASSSIFKMPLGNQIEVDPEEIHVTFEDVKGADEAKQELKDVVEFLKSPEKFSVLGAKLPKGVLLVGPPGTGKTLLARAVAGEANVPFFHAAGPEFDEILVGQGARRVRDLFKAAKERSPCVIFIDEIDSIGSKRTNSVLHPYANQTINQLLSEMDGFHHNQGVIVLGATNRRDDLDGALLRPGRFDVVVTVQKPDFTGRKDILQLYISKILSRDVDIDLLARGTLGFTGADLENMVNQAALHAALDGAEFVTTRYLEEARDKILMGPERKSRIPDEGANLITAYHEGGHAIVAYFTEDSDALHKVTIIPRGPSLGHTAYIPEKENYHVTKSKLLARMDTLMGGRAAEELIFGPDKITSGASSDLKGATSIATHMVKEWGMSEKVGLRTLRENYSAYVLVNELGQNANDAVDSEIKQLLQDSYDRAKAILKHYAKEHKLLAEALMKYETLDADDVKAIMEKKRKPSK